MSLWKLHPCQLRKCKRIKARHKHVFLYQYICSTTLIHNYHGPLKRGVAISRSALWKFAHNPDEFLDVQVQNPMEMNKRTVIAPNLLKNWIIWSSLPARLASQEEKNMDLFLRSPWPQDWNILVSFPNIVVFPYFVYSIVNHPFTQECTGNNKGHVDRVSSHQKAISPLQQAAGSLGHSIHY